GFFVFAFGVAVVNDPGASLEVGDAVFQHNGANDDAGIHVAGETDVAAAAAVGPAPHVLQFVDDLHRPNFRRAADGAHGKSRSQHVKGVCFVEHLALHLADDVHDVGVT